MNHELMDVAILTAKYTPPVARAKVAAVVACRNRIIAGGTNKLKTHPMAKHWGRNPDACYLHAEIDAIYKADRVANLGGMHLYVARTWKNGEAAMSKPCSGCQKAINFFGIKHTFYTMGNGKYGEL